LEKDKERHKDEEKSTHQVIKINLNNKYENVNISQPGPGTIASPEY